MRKRKAEIVQKLQQSGFIEKLEESVKELEDLSVLYERGEIIFHDPDKVIEELKSIQRNAEIIYDMATSEILIRGILLSEIHGIDALNSSRIITGGSFGNNFMRVVEHLMWSSRKVAAWMAGELGLASVAVQRGWEALRAVGWSVQAPRPEHPAGATPEEREAFKKTRPAKLAGAGTAPAA